MEEKKYLKWYNKIGYGSGDIAGNVVYAFLTSFMMVYLTDSVGLAAGVVGTLIAVSKLFDGFTDIFFGSMIDKTHSKMGKAKPWMLYGYIGCAITLVCCFAVPVSLGTTAKYAWFFISYTLLNGVFYTANNIAYSALTSLITKNSKERVQMGSYRFIFAFSTSLLIQAITVGFVDKCGGDAAAWRTVAIIYAIIGLVINTISALSVKELPEEELNEGEVKADNEKYGMVQAFKLLVKNKYYMMICGTYILQQLYGAMIGAGIYYMTWVLKNKNLFGQFAWAVNIPLIIALIFTPTLVGKWKGIEYNAISGQLIIINEEQQILCQRDDPKFDIFNVFEVSMEDIQHIRFLLNQTSVQNNEITLQIKAKVKNDSQMYHLKLHTLWSPLKKDGYIGIVGYFDTVK